MKPRRISFDEAIVADNRRARAEAASVGRLDVMCCCDPDNVKGTLPADTPGIPRREWEDEEGNRGVAFSAHDSVEALSRLPGFEARHKGRGGGKKGGKRTWRNKGRPKRTWRD